MKKPFFLLLLLSCSFFYSRAAIVDTVSIYSNAMHKSSNCVVIKPGNGQSSFPLPVLYLLHGHSGDFSNWITKVPHLKDLADQYSILIVCPDGAYSSCYFDSPIDSTMRYETYIGKEVPEYIDAHYSTIRDRTGRAITGLSMGGHGGLFIGFRHAGTFGACGSMSGGVDINAAPRNRFDIMKRIGDTIAYADNWREYSVINVIEQYPKDSLAIIVDCGTEDFFYEVNHALHDKMLRLKIPHDYIERPGKHDWSYWSNAIKYQMLFFNDYFNKYRKESAAARKFKYIIPNGWGIELIPFPMGFAPSLDYKGFEELRFAPGWGNANSNEKWAYTIVWWLDRVYPITGSILQHNLETYYTGLARQTAIDNKLDISALQPAKFTVQKIKPDKGDYATYTATGSFFDAFVTKKQGILYVKIHVKGCAEAEGTILLYEVAANPYTTPVWKDLHKINAVFSCVN